MKRNAHELQLTVGTVIGRYPCEPPAAESRITGTSLRAVPGDQRVIGTVTVDSGRCLRLDELTDDQVGRSAPALKQKTSNAFCRRHRHCNPQQTRA